MSSFEKLSLICQVFIIVAGVFTVFIYYRQLKSMQSQLVATKEQLSSSFKTQQTSQYQAALQLMFDWRSEAIANPDLVQHFSDDPYFQEVFNIIPVQQYFHTLKLFHIFELYWLLRQRSVINDQMWEGWANNVKILVRPEKNLMIWKKLKNAGIFNPGFVEFVEDMIKNSEIKKIEP